MGFLAFTPRESFGCVEILSCSCLLLAKINIYFKLKKKKSHMYIAGRDIGERTMGIICEHKNSFNQLMGIDYLLTPISLVKFCKV